MRAEGMLAPAACLTLSLCLGMACEREAPRALECSAPARVTELAGVHYEGVGCEAATDSAETRLQAAYYRKACQQLAPDAGLPARVRDAYVAECVPAPAGQGGSILKIQLCCE